jgi:plastocyanin
MSRMHRSIVAAAVAGLALLPLAPAGAAAEVEIKTAATQFVPAFTDVPAGSGVSWVNVETQNYPVLIGNHNIVPDTVAGAAPGTKPFPASSPLIEPGGTWTCTGGEGGPTCTGIDGSSVQLQPGRYAYMCGLHPNHMHGILTVS